MDYRGRSRPLHEWVIAIGVTALLHAGLIAVFVLDRPAPDFVYEAGEAGMQVTLLGPLSDAGGEMAPQTLADALFEDLRPVLRPDGLALSAEQRRSRPRSLSEVLGEPVAAPEAGRAADPTRGSAEAMLDLWGGRLGDPRARASVPRPVRYDERGKPIACWSKPTERLAVKINVLLDPRGVMVGRPEIVASASPEAERKAMRALAGCSPYASPTVPGLYQVMELDFAKDRNWMREVARRIFR